MNPLEDIIALTKRGEDKLDMGAIDLAFDCFIDIREKVTEAMLSMQWSPMAECPDATPVIGIQVNSGQDDTGVICGTKYDINPLCIMDWQRGRWLQCDYFCIPPVK